MNEHTRTDFYPSRQAAEPERRERMDPVAYGEWHEGAPLSEAQTHAFDRDGYLVLRDVLSEDEVTLLQQEAGQLLGDPRGLADETVIYEPGGGPHGTEVRSIFAVHDQSALMQRLASDARLAGVARFLLDDEVTIHQSRLNYKPGFRGKEFYWHSDFETWHVEDGMPRMRALSISVLLAPNNAHNGPLMLMPGSHRTYLSCVGETPENHYKMSLRQQDYGVPDEFTLAQLAQDHGIVAPLGEPGTVIIFDCNTMHGSNGNITPWPRSNLFFVYNAVSNRLGAPFGPKTPRPDFIASRTVHPLTPSDGPLTGFGG
jgi:ectoine hydroxylase